MAEDPIPADVRDFIIKNIDSIAYLEALLLLRTERGSAWSAQTVASRLYISEAEATDILARLSADGFAGLVEQGVQFQADTQAEEMIARLALLYARHLIPVTNLIHSRPGRIRAFASAFRLRKDP